MVSIQRPRPHSPAYSQQVIKDQNSTLLFNLIRERSPISRAELSRISGLSPATVTVLIDELIHNQWVLETSDIPVSSGRGRRPILLEVNASLGYVVVIDINTDGYMCSLYDICQNKMSSQATVRPSSTAEEVHRSVLALLRQEQIAPDRLLGIHILYPGLFHSKTGFLRFSTVVPYLSVVEPTLVAYLKEQFPSVDVRISNNSQAMAYAVFTEHSKTAALPLIAISVHEGIGAGFADADTRCVPVEAGHTIIDPAGPRCQCGNRGCLEAYCSTTSLLRTINRETSMKLKINELYGSEQNRRSMLLVAEAYHRGQEDVVRVIRAFARHLCTGIVGIINLFSVKSLFLGGIIQLLGEPFIELMKQILQEEYHFVTDSGSIALQIFEYDFENARKAAVRLTLEYLFQRK